MLCISIDIVPSYFSTDKRCGAYDGIQHHCVHSTWGNADEALVPVFSILFASACSVATVFLFYCEADELEAGPADVLEACSMESSS